MVPIASAALPTSPSSPKPLRNLVLGLAVGLLLGFAYAMVRNTLDKRLRSAEDVERIFGVPVAGVLPLSKSMDRHSSGSTHLVVLDKAGSRDDGGAAEAFRKLRTNLLFMDVDNPPRVIVVTSPGPGDGKSTIAANLAAAIAASGQPAMLVDADLRRPMVAASLGLVESVGLTDVLVGRITLDEAVQTLSDDLDLQVLAAGRIPPNPSELLGSNAMRELLKEISSTRLVILDSPPLLPVTDAAILAANTDGAFIAITTGSTVEHELESSLDHLQAVNAKPLGVIMNKVQRRAYGYYEGYYKSYVSAATTPKREGEHGSKAEQAHQANDPVSGSGAS